MWSVPACRRAGCVSAVPGCVSWDLREAVARSWKNSKLPVLTHLRRSAGRYRASKNSPGQLQKQATNVTCLTPVPGGARQTSSGEQAGQAGPMPRYRSETGRRSACRPTRTTTTRTAAGAALGAWASATTLANPCGWQSWRAARLTGRRRVGGDQEDLLDLGLRSACGVSHRGISRWQALRAPQTAWRCVRSHRSASGLCASRAA